MSQDIRGKNPVPGIGYPSFAKASAGMRVSGFKEKVKRKTRSEATQDPRAAGAAKREKG